MMKDQKRSRVQTEQEATFQRIALGLESGELVSDSPAELEAIKRARGKVTRLSSSVETPTPVRKTEEIRPRTRQRTTEEVSREIRGNQPRPNNSGVSVWKKHQKTISLVLISLLTVGLIGVGTHYLTSSATDAKTAPSPKSSVQTEPKINTAPAPTPQPRASGNPAPSPTPRPTPQPKASGNPTPPGGTSVSPPVIGTPAPVIAPTPIQQPNAVTPTPPTKVYDQTDSTPEGSSQRSSKITDTEHGDGNMNDGLGNQTTPDSPTLEF